MIVTYRPDGQDTQKWEFDPKKVRSVEAELIEKHAGEPWDQWYVLVVQGSVRARRVLLWHLLKTAHPTLRLDDVDFAVGELEVEFTRDELEAMREQAVTAPGIPDQQRELALSALDTMIASAPAAQASGKARSKSAG